MDGRENTEKQLQHQVLSIDTIQFYPNMYI